MSRHRGAGRCWSWLLRAGRARGRPRRRRLLCGRSAVIVSVPLATPSGIPSLDGAPPVRRWEQAARELHDLADLVGSPRCVYGDRDHLAILVAQRDGSPGRVGGRDGPFHTHL